MRLYQLPKSFMYFSVALTMFTWKRWWPTMKIEVSTPNVLNNEISLFGPLESVSNAKSRIMSIFEFNGKNYSTFSIKMNQYLSWLKSYTTTSEINEILYKAGLITLWLQNMLVLALEILYENSTCSLIEGRESKNKVMDKQLLKSEILKKKR